MRVLILGASSQVGYFLVPTLAQRGHQVLAVSRHGALVGGPPTPGVQPLRVADYAGGLRHLPQADAAIVLTPILASESVLEPLLTAHPKRVIAFSSTAFYTRQRSVDPGDRQFAANAARLEQLLSEQLTRRDISWAILRPTLIYGCGMDKNVTAIARFIRRFGFFPVIRPGQGCRQPVHAEDLAHACARLVELPEPINTAFNLSGGERLTYTEMVERIFRALGKPVRILPMPRSAVRGLLHLARQVPAYRYLSLSMADRMNEDLCFDHGDAHRVFGYAPRGFAVTASELEPPVRR